ncbi:MAG: PIG-L deacetylase family protein, partial [Planctomycetota bacterium JB042]
LPICDGAIVDTPDRREAVVGLLRRHAPRLVLAPFPRDEHPDHEHAGRLVKAAWYLAGIRRAPPTSAKPHRAPRLWFYPSHEVHDVRLVVAVTAEDVDAKRRALACYPSQFHDPTSKEPETRISTPTFLEEGFARMRHFGSLIGAEYGEPFALPGPLGIADPSSLLDGTDR